MTAHCFAWAGWRAQVRLVDWLPAEQEMQVVEVEGYVADLPQATRFGNRFLFVPQQVITQGAHLPQRISVNWYGDPDRVRAGERWLLVLKPKRPHGQINPGGFDLESWFLQHGIGATATVQYGRKLPGLAAAAFLAAGAAAGALSASWPITSLRLMPCSAASFCMRLSRSFFAVSERRRISVSTFV